MASRQKDIKTFFKKLKKRYPDDPVVLSRDRKILEHLAFAIFLENATFEQARVAFTEMQRYFIDWNEIRVSTAVEIASVVRETPDAVHLGERLRRLLQWVFDKTFKFDLEDMRVKGEEEVTGFLATVPFSTRFVNDYVSFFGFNSVDKFPLDEGCLRIFRLLGLVTISNDKETVPCLTSSFKANEAREFFFAIHELGAELMNEATRLDVLKFLKAFDPDVEKRSPAPLVESQEPTDPLEIARLYAKRERRPKSVASLMSEEIIDDLDSEEMEEPDGLLEVSESVESFSDFSTDIENECGTSSRGQRSGRELRRRSNSTEEASLSKDQTTFRRFTSEEPESSYSSKKTRSKRGTSKQTHETLELSSYESTSSEPDVEQDLSLASKASSAEFRATQDTVVSGRGKGAKSLKSASRSKSDDSVEVEDGKEPERKIEKSKSKRVVKTDDPVPPRKSRKSLKETPQTEETHEQGKRGRLAVSSVKEEEPSTASGRTSERGRVKVVKKDGAEKVETSARKSAKKEKESASSGKTSNSKCSKVKETSNDLNSEGVVSKSEKNDKKTEVRRSSTGAGAKEVKGTKEAKGRSGVKKSSSKKSE